MGARRLRRARTALAGACCLAGLLVAFELPLGQILQQRGELSRVDNELSATAATNHRLSAAIAALRKSTTVAAIAHEEYGLVARGQRAYAILPSAGSGASLVDRTSVPAGALVPASISPYSSPATPGPAVTATLWQRVVDRLAFWRWAF